MRARASRALTRASIVAASAAVSAGFASHSCLVAVTAELLLPPGSGCQPECGVPSFGTLSEVAESDLADLPTRQPARRVQRLAQRPACRQRSDHAGVEGVAGADRVNDCRWRNGRGVVQR